MFSQIQNVVSSRELFTSNPCRDLWDSQMFSQTGSGSQGSQPSSSELFSQPKSSSQQPRSTSNYGDTWSTTTSQHAETNEDHPIKYYMKYMAKPPLFPDQSKGKTQDKNQAEDFREFIEAQKKKAVERDQRDLLDSFIGLLKEYTKEVQLAMTSFTDSISSSMAVNVEQITSAADKSVDIVTKIKEDFAESFSELKKDLKENEDFRKTIFTHEKEVAKKEEETKLFKVQIEEFKERERKALEREEKYLERERQLLEKLKEIEAERTVVETSRTSKGQQEIEKLCDQLAEFRKRESKALEREEKYLEREQQLLEKLKDQAAALEREHPPLVPSHHTQGTALFDTLPCNLDSITSEQETELANRGSCHPQQTFPLSHQSTFHNHRITNSVAETFRPHTAYAQAQTPPVMMVGSYTQRSIPHRDVFQGFPPYRGHCDEVLRPSSGAHPTAAIIPVQSSISTQDTSRIQVKSVNYSIPPSKKQITPSTGQNEINFPDERIENSIQAIYTEQQSTSSPGNWISAALRYQDKLPKKSPVATVLPQIQVKREAIEKECIRKKNDDPLGIFFIDLSASSPSSDADVQKAADQQGSSRMKVPTDNSASWSSRSVPDWLQSGNTKRRTQPKPKPPVAATATKRYDTRSHSKTTKVVQELGASRETSYPRKMSAVTTMSNIKRKLTVSRNQNACEKSKKYRSYEMVEHPGKNYSAVHRRIASDKSSDAHLAKKTPFKRNSLKRTINLSSSTMFEVLDEDVSIQQITDSIRKHAQKRKVHRASNFH